MTKQAEETFISFPSRRDRKRDEGEEIQTKSKRDYSETGDADENDIGSNPQGECEDYNDDDPFATWSAPGDPKRTEGEQNQNWLQKGFGGRRGRNNQNSQPIPQSNELIEDPFDSCRDSQRNDDDPETYTSFADNTSLGSESNNGNDGNATQDRKRFGLFNGLMRGGRR